MQGVRSANNGGKRGTKVIEYLEGHVIYENAKPHVRSRHGYFPGLVTLSSGGLLALFVRAEAFEAANATTYVTRSQDLGRTWQLQGPLYDKSHLGSEMSDYMKPTVLSGGRLLAIGYRFHRKDPVTALTIEETGGFLPGDDIVAFSQDEGRHWTEPIVIEHRHPELIEVSGPAVETQSGDLLAVGALFPLPDGSNPSGPVGVLLRSSDKGHSWNDDVQFYKWANVTPYESRICEMQQGRLVVIVWAYHPDPVAIFLIRSWFRMTMAILGPSRSTQGIWGRLPTYSGSAGIYSFPSMPIGEPILASRSESSTSRTIDGNRWKRKSSGDHQSASKRDTASR